VKAALKVILGLATLAVIGWFVMPVNSAVRYAIVYNVGRDKVFVAPRPHDCDWLSAPLGDKHCHYSPVVAKFAAGGKLIDPPPFLPSDTFSGYVSSSGKVLDEYVVHGVPPVSVQVWWRKIND